MNKLSQVRKNLINGIVNLDKEFYPLFVESRRIRNKAQRIMFQKCLTDAQLEIDDAMAWIEDRNGKTVTF
jgi:hypothetical protein